MKKILVWSLGFLVVIVIYYLTLGSDQINHKLKEELHKELSHLQKSGFTVTTKEKKKKYEHFIVGFNESPKIAHYLSQKDFPLTPREVEALKGLQIGVEVEYLRTCVKILLSPVVLPTHIHPSAQIEKLLAQKAFALTLELPHTMQSVRLSLKDFEEIIDDENTTAIEWKGVNLKANFTPTHLTQLKQEIEKFSMRVQKERITLHNLHFSYLLQEDKGRENRTLSSQIEEIITQQGKAVSRLKKIAFETKLNNFDVVAYTQHQTLNPNTHLEISTFSMESLTLKKQEIEGFRLNASLDVNQSLNLTELEKNPFLALEKTNAFVTLTFSEPLLEVISQQPQAMMPLMMFPPETLKKRKSYRLILKEGILTLNGKEIF